MHCNLTSMFGAVSLAAANRGRPWMSAQSCCQACCCLQQDASSAAASPFAAHCVQVPGNGVVPGQRQTLPRARVMPWSASIGACVACSTGSLRRTCRCSGLGRALWLRQMPSAWLTKEGRGISPAESTAGAAIEAHGCTSCCQPARMLCTQCLKRETCH